MKDKISLFLVLVLLLEAVHFPGLSKSTVLAAPLDSKYDIIYNNTLSNSMENSSPTLNTREEVRPNEAMFKIGLVPDGAENLTLQFPINSREIAQLTINQSDNIADIIFKVFENQDPSKLISETAQHESYLDDFAIYTQDYKHYLEFNEDGSGREVDKDADTPTFKITTERGFAFRYRNGEYKFRWDNDRNFYFTACSVNQFAGNSEVGFNHGFKKGRVFPVYLFDETDHSVAKPAEKRILTGIDKDKFVSSTTSHGQPGVDGRGINPVFNTNEVTAEDINRIKIRIPVPDMWDFENGGFSIDAIKKERIAGILTLQPYEYRNDSTRIIRIDIEDIFDDSLTLEDGVSCIGVGLGREVDGLTTDVKIRDTPESTYRNFVEDGIRYIEFELEELPASRLYLTEFKLDTRQGETPFDYKINYNPDVSKIDFGKVFTFLKYKFHTINNDTPALHVIEPYKDVLGTYTLIRYESESGGRQEEVVRKYYNGNDEELKNFGIINDGVYQFKFDPLVEPGINSKAPLFSQRMKFSQNDIEYDVGLANNFTSNLVTEDYRKHEYDVNKAIAPIIFSWDIAKRAYIDNMFKELEHPREVYIDYQLYKTLSPDEVNLGGNDEVFRKVRIKITSENLEYKIEYKWFDGDDLVGEWEEIPQEGSGDPLRAVVKDDFIAHKNPYDSSVKLPSDELTYPDVYFFNIKPVSIQKGSDNEPKELSVDKSRYDFVTLDDFDDTDIPTPEVFRVFDAVTRVDEEDNDLEVSLKVSWSMTKKKIQEYFKKMGSIKEDTDKVKYNIYVSQDEKLLKDLMNLKKPQDSLDGRFKNGVVFEFDESKMTSRNAFYMSSINENDVNVKRVTAGSNTPLEELRDGKYVVISNIVTSDWKNWEDETVTDFQYIFDGLDKNQTYYFAIDAIYEYENAGNSGKQIDLSKMVGIPSELTKGDPEKPSPGDKYPTSPNVKAKDITSTSATVYWNHNDDKDPNVSIEYEIIRTNDIVINQEYLYKRDDFATFFNNPSHIKDTSRAVGFRIEDKKSNDDDNDDNSRVVKSFDGSSFSKVSDGATAKVISGEMNLLDRTLRPNQIYVYYVRTVQTYTSKNDEKVLYSTWNQVSVTSDPVKHPLNLTWERDFDPHDKEQEVVISFDAMVPDSASLDEELPRLDKLGVEYDFEYSIQREEEEWSEPILIPASSLRVSGMYKWSIKEKGFINFTYKISGLDPGTNYSIKVRQVDKVINTVSMYSNIIDVRTKLNQDDFDDEEDQKLWKDYLEEELRKLIRNYYWTSIQSSTEFEAIYRPSMFNGLTTSLGNHAPLAENNAPSLIYFIPVGSIVQANNSGKGFKIIQDDVEILIPANAFDTTHDPAFIEMIEAVRKKEINDYYVKIIVNSTEYKDDINGDEALSKRIDISYELVGSTMSAMAFDEHILKLYLEEIKDQLEDDYTTEELNAMVKEKELPEEMVKYVASVVKDTSETLISETHEEFVDTLKFSAVIKELSSPAVIRYKNQASDMNIKGYELSNGKWVNKEIIDQGSHYAIYAKVIGSYIFAGGKVSIPDLDGVANGDAMIAVIVKYGLDEYLGKGENFSLQAPVTTYMMNGVTAKLMGASSTSDINAFLKSKGYFISGRQTGFVSKQEAIYMIMGVYEVRTNTKVDSVKILNYNQTAGIQNVDTKYIQPVRVAYQLGFYDNYTIDAQSTASVEDLMQMILKLQSKGNI